MSDAKNVEREIQTALRRLRRKRYKYRDNLRKIRRALGDPEELQRIAAGQERFEWRIVCKNPTPALVYGHLRSYVNHMLQCSLTQVAVRVAIYKQFPEEWKAYDLDRRVGFLMPDMQYMCWQSFFMMLYDTKPEQLMSFLLPRRRWICEEDECFRVWRITRWLECQEQKHLTFISKLLTMERMIRHRIHSHRFSKENLNFLCKCSRTGISELHHGLRALRSSNNDLPLGIPAMIAELLVDKRKCRLDYACYGPYM